MARDLVAALPVASGWLFLALWTSVVAAFAAPLMLMEPLSSSVLLPMRSLGEVLLALVILLAMFRSSIHIRILALLLLSVTAWLTWRAGDWGIIEKGLRSSLAVGAFMPVVVLLRSCAERSPTIPAIRQRLGEMPAPERRAWMTTGSHFLAAIITLGYLSVLRPMLPTRLDETERSELARCGVRGLGLSILWSPFFVATAVATQWVHGVRAWQTLLLGSVMAAIGAVLAHLMFNRELDFDSWRRAIGRLTPILVPVGALVGTVVAVSSLAGIGSLLAVVLVVPVMCFGNLLWYCPNQIAAVIGELVKGAGRMSDEVVIMTVSALFAVAMLGTAAPEFVSSSLITASHFPVALILIMVAMITGLGLLGLHPMVSASVLVPLSVSLQLPLAPTVLAHIVIFAWALSSIAAAWTVPVVITAAAFEVPVRQLTIGANLRFILVYGVVGCLTLATVNELLR